ncbi:L-lactate dehydrogenase [Rhodovulum sp. PH10]|uniref:alpha-hydroxy-acid oxidizing protein n=1 Tax=Rhodovulum sp. PH10 TaxID=1187851 RepID=UPI00027C1FCA|nr:alpha-hydroxy-acid oxidizing protein [Rhodovulum sp. PH10]EJW12942.1 L-lactate dehydrogenase [Rhodovulum sp. PH10]
MTARGRARQAGLFVSGMAGRRPAVPVSAQALEQKGIAALGREAAAYVAGGAGLERTMAANRAAFDRWRIVPRMLAGAAQRDLTVELFGRRLPLPLLLAPIGVLDLAHRDGDLPAARAAAAAGIPFVVSNQACRPLEEIAAATGSAPRWFQLYWSACDALTESLVARAEQAGYEAIVVTLDTTMLGWRPRDLDGGYLPFVRGRGLANYLSDPVFRALAEDPAEGPDEDGESAGAGAKNPRPSLAAVLELLRHWPGGAWEVLASDRAQRAIRRFLAVYSRPSLRWDDLPFLRARTRLPILLKGIVHPDDARRAIDAGADGLVVSNHGGRQVDGALGALAALPEVVRAVDGRIPVLFDSGVRTGADVVKAIALGAAAVLIGRPYVYGLALAGERGVAEVIDNLAADLDLTLALAGRRTLAELDPSMLALAAPAGPAPRTPSETHDADDPA